MSLSSARSNPDELAEPESDDLDPVTVEKNIQRLIRLLSSSLTDWRKLYRASKEADRAFDAAFATAKINVDKDVPYADRGQHATLATMDEREAKDLADEAFKYAEKRYEAIGKALNGWQSVGKSVNEAYRNAGRGDGFP